MRFSLLLALAPLLGSSAAVPSKAASFVKQLYQFPTLNQVENLVVRQNGELLLTVFGLSQVFALDPNSRSPEPRPAVRLPVNSSTGIAELTPTRYAIMGGDLLAEKFRFINGTVSLYVADFVGSNKEATISKVISIPTFIMPNGLAPLPSHTDVVMGADSNGRIIRLDIQLGTVEVVLEDALLAYNADAVVPIGVNGIKILNGYLYYTNSALGAIGRIPMSADGRTFGSIEQFAFLQRNATSQAYDDFDIDRSGTLYSTRHTNSVVKVLQNGEQSVVVGGGNSTLLLGPTSVALSKHSSLYITTSQGQILEASLC
ncbi:hypothetical protein GQ53DRAFT_745877 [Thozetella sp. PMI_491]|nr:hypothetical protein GQ53DRAFT_745877 [Thozetella sp. PMI_491]